MMSHGPIINAAFSLLCLVAGYWLSYLLFKRILCLLCQLIVAKWLTHGLLISCLLGVAFAFVVTQIKTEWKMAFLWLMLYGMFIANNVFITPAFYWLDKRAAQQAGKERVPESALHAIAFAGAGVSALICQQTMRHKTQKKAFKLITLMAILSTVLIAYLLIKYNPGFI